MISDVIQETVNPEEVGQEIPNESDYDNNSNTENKNHTDNKDAMGIPENKNKNASRNSVATLSSPWQYDSMTKLCAGCRCEFNPLNRRHHCRLCGKIFCHGCSSQRALVPPSSIVLIPKGGKKVKPSHDQASFSPDHDPDRMLTYLSGGDANELLYGKGLEERFKLAREPLRVCNHCFQQLAPLQEDLRASNSNAMRFNHIDPTDARRLFNSPLAHTLGHEIRKAAYALNNLLPQPRRMGALVASTPISTMTGDLSELAECKESCSAISPNLGDLDGLRIPARLLEKAKGIAVLTVVKGGLGLAGFEFGTGLVVARTGGEGGGGGWSAPSAIGTGGISWGALIGAQVSDHVFLLMTDAAVHMMFSNNGSVQLGADVGIAVGPLGRAVEGNLGASVGNAVAPIYTYSLSKGLYAGISLDGKVICTRNFVNEKFYGRPVKGPEILAGAVPLPPAAQPLYEALARCHVYASQLDPSHKTTTTSHQNYNGLQLRRQQEQQEQQQLHYEQQDEWQQQPQHNNLYNVMEEQEQPLLTEEQPEQPQNPELVGFLPSVVTPLHPISTTTTSSFLEHEEYGAHLASPQTSSSSSSSSSSPDQFRGVPMTPEPNPDGTTATTAALPGTSPFNGELSDITEY